MSETTGATGNSTRNLLIGIYAVLVVLAVMIFLVSTGGKSVPNQEIKSQQPPGTTKMSLDDAMKLAIQEHQAGHLDKAEEIYRQVLAAAPDNPFVLHLLGVVAFQSGKLDASQELIKKAIAINPGQADFYANLGNTLVRMGRVDEAIGAYKSALKLNGAHFDALANVGFAWQTKKDFPRAAACYRQAIKSNPNNQQLKTNYDLLMKEHPKTIPAKECPL